MESGKLNASFTVSNTDVITMLVVKNREFLQKEQEVLVKRRNEMADKVIEAAKEKWQKFLDKSVKNNKIIDSYKNLLTLLNPKINFEFTISENVPQNLEYSINSAFGCYRNNHGHYIQKNDKSECVLKQEELYVSVKFPETDEGYRDEERFVFLSTSDGGDGMSIPVKFQFTFKIPKEIEEINKKLNDIENLLKNENSLKEKLVAQVTEKAIKQIPELSSLVGNVELLALS